MKNIYKKKKKKERIDIDLSLHQRDCEKCEPESTLIVLISYLYHTIVKK